MSLSRIEILSRKNSMTANGPGTGRNASGKPIRPRGRLYVSTAIALAVLVVVIALSRWKSDQFTATARLRAESRGRDIVDLGPHEIRRSVTNSSQLKQVLEEMQEDGVAFSAELDAETIRQRLVVKPARGHSPQRLDYKLSYTGDRRDLVVALVNRICNRYVDQQSKRDAFDLSIWPAPPEVDSEAADQANAAVQEAQRQFDVFCAENSDQLPAALVAHPANEVTEQAELNNPLLSQPVMKVSADELISEISSIQFRLASMYANGESSTPYFSELQARAAELKKQLAIVEKEVSSSAAGEQEVTQRGLPPRYDFAAFYDGDTDTDTSDSLSTKPNDQLRQLAIRYRDLEDSVRAATEQQQAVRQQAHPQWPQQLEPQAGIAWTVSPAARAERKFSPMSSSAVFSAMALCLITAGGVALACRGVATIQSADRAQVILSAPVAGTIHESGSIDVPPVPARPWSVRAALVVAEWTLGIMLLAMIVSAFLDTSFAQHVRGNPLAALADGVRYTMDTFWS